MKWELSDFNKSGNTHYTLSCNGIELAKLRVNKDGFFLRMKWFYHTNEQNKEYKTITALELLEALRKSEDTVRTQLSNILNQPRAV